MAVSHVMWGGLRYLDLHSMAFPLDATEIACSVRACKAACPDGFENRLDSKIILRSAPSMNRLLDLSESVFVSLK